MTDNTQRFNDKHIEAFGQKRIKSMPPKMVNNALYEQELYGTFNASDMAGGSLSDMYNALVQAGQRARDHKHIKATMDSGIEAIARKINESVLDGNVLGMYKPTINIDNAFAEQTVNGVVSKVPTGGATVSGTPTLDEIRKLRHLFKRDPAPAKVEVSVETYESVVKRLPTLSQSASKGLPSMLTNMGINVSVNPSLADNHFIVKDQQGNVLDLGVIKDVDIVQIKPEKRP